MMHKNLFEILVLAIFLALTVLSIATARHSRMVDNRYKFYDYILESEHTVHSENSSCIDITDEEIITYYVDEREMTVFGEALLEGRFRCTR